MITEVTGKCQYEGCDLLAILAAKGRRLSNGGGHPDLGVYCTKHACELADEYDSEYVVQCPNCDCLFGVG